VFTGTYHNSSGW